MCLPLATLLPKCSCSSVHRSAEKWLKCFGRVVFLTPHRTQARAPDTEYTELSSGCFAAGQSSLWPQLQAGSPRLPGGHQRICFAKRRDSCLFYHPAMSTTLRHSQPAPCPAASLGLDPSTRNRTVKAIITPSIISITASGTRSTATAATTATGTGPITILSNQFSECIISGCRPPPRQSTHARPSATP